MASEALDSLLQTLRQILKRDDDLTTLRVKLRIISIHDQTVVLQLNLKHFPKEETIREVVNTTKEIMEYIFSPENVSDCASTEASVRLSIQLGELAEELTSTAGDVVDYCKCPDNLVNNVRRRSDSSSRSAIELIVSLLYLLVRVERILSICKRAAFKTADPDHFDVHNFYLSHHLRGFDVKLKAEPTVSISIRLLGLAERIMSTTGDSVDNIGRQSDSPAVSSSSRSALNSEDFDALDGDPTLATKLFVSSNRLARLADRIQWTAGDLIDNSTADGSSPTSAFKSADFDGFDEDLGSVTMQIFHFSGVLGGLAEEIMSAEDYATVGSSSTSALESVMFDGLDKDLASPQFLHISDELGRLADGIMSTAKGSVDNVGRLNDSPAVATETDSISNRLGRLAERIKLTAEDSVKNIGRLSDSPAVGSSSRSALKSEDFDGFDQDLTVSTELTVRISNRLGRLAARINRAAVGSSSRSSPTSKDVVLGFEKDRFQILSWLRSYSSELQVLPIVGMGGIGKSTLAKIVYDDTFITYHFDFHAWVTISKDYSVESILSNLLASMKAKGIQAESDLQREKESEIYKYLKGRRYLIVMDDMWNTVVWDLVRSLLPDDNNGSRIILTTRLKNVATYANSSSPIHMMRFLDDQQSWLLFQKKVFGDQDCPVELQVIGEKYVKRCEGLPLSIVTAAGLLSKIDRTPKSWKQIGTNDGQLETILISLSYKHLPRHLRECFLYMAAFPEDYEIHVSELIKLWVAEGFLEGQNKSKTLEEVAEDVLEVLVEQSLILVTSKKSDGKMKRCKLHSVVRDFCSRQAGEEKFLLPIMDYFPNPIVRRHFLPQVLQDHQRISVSWCDLDLKDSMHSSCTRSIICIPQRGYRPKGSVVNFRSLKVLHVLRRNDHAFWALGEVFDLIGLTYLASNIPSSIVPSAISKLHNLQTLIIYRSEVSLPVEIWGLRQLRHLIAFSFLPLPDPKYSSLENIKTLSLATNFVFSMAAKIPNIRKLEVCYSFVTFRSSPNFDNVKRLRRLEKLKLATCSSIQPCPKFNFPGSLKKLELSGWRLPWTDMMVFCRLPSLQVLKLKNHACYGEHWKTIEGGFVNLRLLHIDESNLQNWTTECSHFPRLQRLMLHRCPYLSEIPVDIGKIATLELIEIDDLNPSLLYSATEIREKRDALQVSLKHF